MVLIPLCSFSQKRGSWTEVEKDYFVDVKSVRVKSLPTDYKLYQFDYTDFASKLVNVPKRGEFSGISNVVISLPMPNGTVENFRIIEASVFEESLQAQFPNIRSFAGQGVEDPSKVLRFSISPEKGLSALIRSTTDQATFIIDPYSMDYKTFIVFDKSKAGAKQPFTCSVDEGVHFGPENRGGLGENEVLNNADDAILRTFRVAISCTGEYAAYHGGTIAGVNAAYNTTMTRVNALYEMDFNTTMVIIPTNNNVVYLNAGTDPYGNTDANYNAELQATLNSQIGAANYDVGHLFSAIGNNGNAGCIGCVCVNTNKGSGFTTSTIPEGESFDVDYVAHEFGHQFGGNHTFSFSAENNAVNMEPGSGVTIMGYAGITGATDVASNSIAIFHAGSIQQITNNIKGKTCQTNTPTGNAVPAPSAPATRTFPIGTAFKLVGTATDANANDVLSYCWEQVDDATTVGAAASYPSGTKTNGANFRSWLPKNNGTRYFPRLEDHVANGVAGNQWEIVPTINRTLNFRLTVRDNRPGGGNNESVNTAVTFTTSAGPFLVTSQNTAGLSYTQGSTQTVTWSVNNTTSLAGSNNVNIKLSTDGGKTFPITLVANTPNDGSQSVVIPNVSAPFCRILIEPTGNDYYAINTNDFAIGYTVTDVCQDFTRNLTSGNTITAQNPLAYQNFVLNIPLNAIISDVNVSTNITHSRTNQLYTAINSPAGTFVALFQTGGCNNASSNLIGTWDSQSATAAGCNFGGGGTMQPVGDLNVLNGQNANGNWFFRVADVTADTRDGTLNSFTFRICYKQIEEQPNACGVITTTWNGSSWSNGAPLKNVVAIFNGNYNSTGTIEACSVVINTGATVTFNAGHTLVVTNEVTVNGTGSLVINNNAALRQINSQSVNSGNIIVRRSSTAMRRLDYTAWSSPVSGQQLQAFSPNTISTRFYEYLYTGNTTPTAYQSVTSTNNFIAGKGYMIRVDNNWSATTPAVYNGQFSGVPFNGNVNQSVGRGYNLLGNPYASPISASKFMFDNETIAGALYFWTHFESQQSGTYVAQSNYASYTTLGGAAAAAGGSVPNGTIQTGQGFFVRALEFGTARFNNDQRVNAASTQFFRNAIDATENEKHRIWLNLNSSNESHNQILVGYTDGATNGFDNLIDARVIDEERTMLYNIINDEPFVIQGKGLPFSDNDIISLGFKALASGTYFIDIENVDGLFSNQDIYVKDKMLNITHDLKQGQYQFNSDAGDFKNRFELVFKPSTLSDEIITPSLISIYSSDNVIKVNASENIQSIEVYDVLGRVLFNNINVNEKEFIINTLIRNNQPLIVKVKDASGSIKSQKIIF